MWRARTGYGVLCVHVMVQVRVNVHVASRPVLLSQGLGLLTFSHAGVRRILAYT